MQSSPASKPAPARRSLREESGSATGNVPSSKTAVCEPTRVSWYPVGRIIVRVVAEIEAMQGEQLDGLRRIAIGELSYRVGQRYITVVVDHDTGWLVWAADGRDKQTVAAFFAALGTERCRQLELVSSDIGEWCWRRSPSTAAAAAPPAPA